MKTHERRPHTSEARRLTIDVVTYARLHGCLVSTHPEAHGGAPQLAMVRTTDEGDNRCVFARILGPNDRPSRSQVEWIDRINRVGTLCRPHLSAYAWRPTDWPSIEELLR